MRKTIAIVVGLVVGIGFAAFLYNQTGTVSVPVVLAWIPSVFGWGGFSLISGALVGFGAFAFIYFRPSAQSATTGPQGEVVDGPNFGDPPEVAAVDNEGWTRCPGCNFRFNANDPNFWDGRRHRRCGQAITLLSQ